MKLVILIALLLAVVYADTFSHACGVYGGNNKLNEERNDNNRDTNNRIFDSQNGNAGGVYVGDYGNTEEERFYLYPGTKVRLQWTNQHSLGETSYSSNTEYVIQMMCDKFGTGSDPALPWSLEDMRDGTTTTQIDNANAGDLTRGMHEPLQYRLDCEARARNTGLYISDRNVGNTAASTIQNNNAGQSGLECPEERDYYPYWHPTPFMDIAVFPSDSDLCDMFQDESQNVQGKNYCSSPQYNSETSCNQNGGSWEETDPWGIDKPHCGPADPTRENHLGWSPDTGKYSGYDWEVPDMISDKCVLRNRYNMSKEPVTRDMDSSYNGDYGDSQNPIEQDLRLIWGDGTYPFLEMAINTNQVPRTFQDRSHTFEIRKRPDELSKRSTVYLLSVNGYRGALQNIYPTPENDFCPKDLEVKQRDWVLIEWAADSYGQNNARNNGQGAGLSGGQRANRFNIVEAPEGGSLIPMPYDEATIFEGDKELLTDLAFQKQDPAGCAADPNDENDDDNCGVINYVQGGFFKELVQVKTRGTWTYMSTRNNIQTNRAQKATLKVKFKLEWWAILLIALASLAVICAAGYGGLKYQARRNPGGKAHEWLDKIDSKFRRGDSY